MTIATKITVEIVTTTARAIAREAGLEYADVIFTTFIARDPEMVAIFNAKMAIIQKAAERAVAAAA